MLKVGSKTFLLALILLSMTAGVVPVAAHNPPSPEGKTAILIASFGTTVPSAVKAIANITEQVRRAYPKTEVRITFTSNIIRSVWRARRAVSQKWLDQGIPAEVLEVKNIIQTMGDLREDGYSNIIVQPTHMFYMEQSQDLANYIGGLASIKTLKERWKPFNKIVLGRPALGMPGDRYNYHDDIASVVETLDKNVEMARKEGAILLYMGHGNTHWSTGIYGETQKKMRLDYPDVQTFIGVVEGSPSLADLMDDIDEVKVKKIILLPFMITAGDHANNDMAGPEEDSWKSILTAKGYEVYTLLEGMGSNDAFARLFVERIADAAKEVAIVLQ